MSNPVKKRIIKSFKFCLIFCLGIRYIKANPVENAQIATCVLLPSLKIQSKETTKIPRPSNLNNILNLFLPTSINAGMHILNVKKEPILVADIGVPVQKFGRVLSTCINPPLISDWDTDNNAVLENNTPTIKIII